MTASRLSLTNQYILLSAFFSLLNTHFFSCKLEYLESISCNFFSRMKTWMDYIQYINILYIFYVPIPFLNEFIE